MPSFKSHFNKYNKVYSFALLILITIMVSLLFLKVEDLDLAVHKNMGKQLEGRISDIIYDPDSRFGGLTVVDGDVYQDDTGYPADLLAE